MHHHKKPKGKQSKEANDMVKAITDAMKGKEGDSKKSHHS
jgi:hypothetical protein